MTTNTPPCSICAGTQIVGKDEPCICKDGTEQGEVNGLRELSILYQRMILEIRDIKHSHEEGSQHPCNLCLIQEWIKQRLENGLTGYFSLILIDKINPVFEKKVYELRDLPSNMEDVVGFGSVICESCEGTGCDNCDGNGTIRSLLTTPIKSPILPPSEGAKRFDLLRRKLNMTMGDVAEAMNISVFDVSNLRRGLKEPVIGWGEFILDLYQNASTLEKKYIIKPEFQEKTNVISDKDD